MSLLRSLSVPVKNASQLGVPACASVFSVKASQRLLRTLSAIQHPKEKPLVSSARTQAVGSASVIILNLLLVLPVCQARASDSPRAFCRRCLAFLSALV